MEAFWIILVAILVSLNSSLIGSYLVLRKSTMMGDAISHAVLPGIVLSYLITNSLSSGIVILGAIFASILAIFLIGFLNKKVKLQIDASIGIIFTFLFAIGVILISFFTKKVDLDQECVLYGELVYIPLNLWILDNGITLGPKALYSLIATLIVNFTFIFFFWKQFNITTFDENFSSTIGINSSLWNYVILTLAGLTTVTAFESVGIILIISFLAIPSASAYLITNSLKKMILLSSFIGILSSFGGYYLAIFTNTNIASCMAIVAGGSFFSIFFYNKFIRRYMIKSAKQH